MQLLLDPADLWIGKPGRLLNTKTGRPPIAFSDQVTVIRDSAPVQIDALANDIDPDGGALTLTSAFAALGTATVLPSGRIEYRPIPGFTGGDSIVYEIADAQGGTDTGQVDIDVIAPVLDVVATAGGTLEVVADTGALGLDVTSSDGRTGSYPFDSADLATGPQALAPPAIIGTVQVGETLTAKPGLWAYDVAGGLPAQAFQWRLNGGDIAGATGATHVVTAGEAGGLFTVTETRGQTAGARASESAGVQGSGGGSFDPTQDAAIISWWDADDAATITETSGAVSLWADKAGSQDLEQTNGTRQPQTGTRILGGRNVLAFASGAFIEAPSFALPGSGDVAFHMVLEIDAAVSAFGAILAAEAANDFQIDARTDGQFDGRLNLAGSGSPVDFTGGPFAGACLISAIFDAGGQTAEVFIGGVSRGQTAYMAPLDAAAALHVMANRSKNAMIDGGVAEIVVTGDLTLRGDYETYLSGKWGVS